MAHACLTFIGKDKCIECYKLRSSLIGTIHNEWKATIAKKKRSEKYQVAVTYQTLSESLLGNGVTTKVMFVKIYPLPVHFEVGVYQEEVYLDSDDTNPDESDSDQLFDNLVSSYQERRDNVSEEEMRPLFLGSGRVVGYTTDMRVDLKPFVSDSSDGEDTKIIYRAEPFIFWFYEVDQTYTIKDIRIVPLRSGW